MNINFPEGNFKCVIYGVRGKIVNDDIPQTGMSLMKKFFELKKESGYEDNGIMIWAYLSDDIMFVGTESKTPPADNSGLEELQIDIPGYASYRHVGPYSLLHDVHTNFMTELKKSGLDYSYPCLEIYSHWVEDESKLVTDIIYSVKNPDNDN